MLDIITHRGPDDEGRWTGEHLSFGMRRLSIIDLAGGHQPIWNPDRTAVIVFNGEIYNYRELRPALADAGYRFTTNSDTEVILALYDQVGRSDPRAMLRRLRGMFGFAIWDERLGRLFLARDHFGIKPLYVGFAAGGELCAFGSELKSLLLDPRIDRSINTDAVVNYLSFQFNPLTDTMVRGVRRIPPGNYLLVDLPVGQCVEESFWEFEFAGDATDLGAATAATRDIVRDSVVHHMISDVPVGAFLSGGVDSAITATLMQQQRREHGLDPVKTFTIGFDEVSELAEARQVARRIGSDHHEVRVARDEYLDVLDSVAWHFDEPVADPSAVALYFLARAAREQVKVVLSGEGADELFGGYLIYREPRALAPIARAPRALRAAVYRPLSSVPVSFPGRGYLRRGLTPFEERYIGNAYIFRPREVRGLWRGDLPAQTHIRPAQELSARLPAGLADARRMQLVDIAYWLPGDILAKADRMTMAHSLELRVPYLDVEVAGLAARIPDAWKYRDGTTKWLLRRAFADMLPKETAARRKLGFPTPLRYWLRQDPEWFRSRILGDDFIRERMRPEPIAALFDQHLGGTADNSRKIYVLLMLALWRRAFPSIG